MARILALDFGAKRTGIAVTDPLQIICSPLETVETAKLLDFLVLYLQQEEVELFVMGDPRHADGNPTHLQPAIIAFEARMALKWPEIPIVRADERYTSKEAARIILLSGKGKMKRQEKGLVDKISASLILQYYMDRNAV